MDKDKIIYELFKLLDDIDTADDIAKGNDVNYRTLVRRSHLKRFEVLTEDQIDELYNKYKDPGESCSHE